MLARAKAILEGLETFGEVGGSSAPKPKESPQLGLFVPAAGAKHPALDTLRALDVERLTPIDALVMLSTLKRMAEGS